MSYRQLVRGALALSIAGFVAPSAWAGVSSSATLGPITIQAIDLDPSDGFAPWVAFVESPGWSVMQEVALWRTDPSKPESAQRLLFGSTDCRLARSNTVASVQTSLTECTEQSLPDPTLSASGQVRSFDSVLNGDAAGYSSSATTFYARDYNSGYFSAPIEIIVSPMTAIVISADASIDVHGGADGTAQARAWLGLRASWRDRDGPVVSFAYTAAASETDRFAGGQRLVARFDNTDPDGYRMPGLDAGVFVQGVVHAQVVPEPGSAALLLAGLAVVGGGGARRRVSAALRSMRPA